ncbi:CPBP family intramembrane glutamic endopeptidase [Clostridium culturomicium]|uniref:CPBP family intramembrane glutamic endopeptidase n=1 Tax=Clostridium culturomicium TaxID=1499683 RepID=UPI0005901052|nr:type II CAAX endopeptidase family protein [Clostridium culturomicium]
MLNFLIEGYIKIILQCLSIIIIIKIFDKLMKLEKEDVEIYQLNKSTVFSLIAVFTYIILSFIYLKYFESVFPQNGILKSIIVKVGILSPTILFIILNKEKLSSLGISKKNILNSIIIGLICSLVYMVTYIIINNSNYFLAISRIDFKLFVSLLYLFVYCMVIAIVEEFLYRGYLQTRLVASYGNKRGLLFSTIIFTLMHLPQWMSNNNFSISITDILLQGSGILPLSFVFGYLYMKTKNLTSCIILHTFSNWIVFALKQFR